MILLRKLKINGFKKYISCCFFECCNYSALGFIFCTRSSKSKRRTIGKRNSELAQNEDAPKLIENEEIKVITRENAINES